MTLAASVRFGARMIGEIASWLKADIELGAFAYPASMSAIDLEKAETTLRGLADECRDRRAALIGNVPEEYRIAAE